MSTELTIQNEWSKEKVELLKRTICKGATNDELELFLGVCKRVQLDPFSKQIYAVKRWDSREQREIMQPQVSVDGLRIVAERTGKYDGQEGPFWCGPDGIWKEIWIEKEFPVASKVIVFKNGSPKGTPGVAHWEEYVAMNKQGQVTKMWQEKPALMLAKCAESLALRKAFPNDLSGLYSGEEMNKAQPELMPIVADVKATIENPTASRTLEQLNQGPLKGAVTKVLGNVPNDFAPNPIVPEETSKKILKIPYGKYEGVPLISKPVEHWVEYRNTLRSQITPEWEPAMREKALSNIEVIEKYLKST